jgi:hypothetical protein
MSLHKGRSWSVLFVFLLVLALSACGGDPTDTSEPATLTPTAQAPDIPPTDTPTPTLTPTPTPEAQQPAAPTPTPTPTTPSPPQQLTATPTSPPSACEGLNGQLEVKVLVGPADAVGLEPVAVGSVPFAVTTSTPPYLVQGQGPISYHAVLETEWGTYDVTMDLANSVQGDCSGEVGSEQLDLVLESTGDQLVVVDSPDFHGEYPWSGTNTLDLAFPLQEGAMAEGEGWVVVLHLGGSSALP